MREARRTLPASARPLGKLVVTATAFLAPDIAELADYINQKPLCRCGWLAMGFHMSTANIVPLPRRSNFTLIPNQFLAIAVQAKLSVSDVRVYLAIAQHAGPNGDAWPSLVRIGELTGISDPANISRSIRQLEKTGLLSRRRVRNPAGRWDRTNSGHR
jgi:hypothetical protein